MIEHFNDARDWFFAHRFGLFIHWGIYAVNGLHEQEQQRYQVPAEDYVKQAEQFQPRHFDPEHWLDLAQATGMDYMVFTTKHHDGFCMWNSQLTDFSVMNTPCGRDLVGELAAACHRRNFPLELYYSVVDWHHPAYPNIGRHHEIMTDVAAHDEKRYLDFLRGQIRELCSGYGSIHGIWWDMNVPQWRDSSVHAMIRELQPAALINNRGFDDGDYSTPERDFDPEGANPDDMAFKRPTEACQSVGVSSWSFRRDEDYYSIRYFQQRIARTLAMGGNYLLNVGPDADGDFTPEALHILNGLGPWFKRVRPALTASPVTGLVDNRRVLITRDAGATYVICPDGLDSSSLSLRPLDGLPRSVTLLNSGETIATTLEPIVYERHLSPALRLTHIPVSALNEPVPVFRLEF